MMIVGRWSRACLTAMLFIACIVVPGAAQADSELRVGGGSNWTYPASEAVRAEVLQWIAQQEGAESLNAEVDKIWPVTGEVRGVQLLDRVVEAIALAHPSARELRTYCATEHGNRPLPDVAWLESETSDLVKRNLRLYYGRWLAQNRLYDDALTMLDGLKSNEVADPASLLFYRSVCQHWMLAKTEGLATLNELLTGSNELPRRYQSLAVLMQADLLALDDDSLDHISRRMGDIRRRLELGDRVKKTIEVEDGVIASLDKLIKDMEDKQQQQQQKMSQSQGGAPSGSPVKPAEDSKPLGGKGPGEVVKKDIGSESGWGDLPPKQRQEALQAMSKDLPSHYREVVEFYFRRLASEGNTANSNSSK